ncbi:spermidine synthase [Pseudactinotalea sp. Z1739]|uniref:spermidine synthase n=1 Tax=Pseudactinotalea sp. Z1739 TaxID=3413028 RepID=UPI003C7DB69D
MARRKTRSVAPSVAALPQGPIPTTYATVELTPDTEDPNGVLLLLDGVQSSHLYLDDPTRLMFEYMQQMQVVLTHRFGPEEPLNVVHLGGAGCALPRAMAALWPDSRHLVAEIDAKLAEYVRTWFDLPRAPRLRIRVADARATIASLRSGGGDAVIRDTFAAGAVPPHLRTVEFTELVADRLNPAGCYLLNLADNPPLPVARREAATLAEVFAHTAVIAEPGVLRGRRYGNVVILGANRPWPTAQLNRSLRTLAPTARVLHGRDLRDFIGTAQVFRDPVESDQWRAGEEPTQASESAEQRMLSMLPDTREDPDGLISLP